MANNRMWLRCIVCGKSILLGKQVGTTGWYQPKNIQPLNEWFNQHDACGYSEGYDGPKDTTGLPLHYRMEYNDVKPEDDATKADLVSCYSMGGRWTPNEDRPMHATKDGNRSVCGVRNVEVFKDPRPVLFESVSHKCKRCARIVEKE